METDKYKDPVNYVVIFQNLPLFNSGKSHDTTYHQTPYLSLLFFWPNEQFVGKSLILQNFVCLFRSRLVQDGENSGSHRPGWPDWANFRLLCVCFTMGGSRKFVDYFFPSFVFILTKNLFGLHFGLLFQNLIWSPWTHSFGKRRLKVSSCVY
jgi:hypothetical protein